MKDLQHNVVNLLYVIKGAVSAHEMKTDQKAFMTSDEALNHARAALRKIYEQTEQAIAITKRIGLALRAQPRENQELSDISVSEVWQEALEIIQRQYPFNSLEIITHIPEAFPPIRCYRKDLLEIFYIILQNAVQAMSKKGKLIIRSSLQFQADEQTKAVIAISDTGPGIPKEILENIFEPFFTTKALDEGNGLGLCLVKSLVKKNRGSVCVSSFKGCGATFTLSFPIEKTHGKSFLETQKETIS